MNTEGSEGRLTVKQLRDLLALEPDEAVVLVVCSRTNNEVVIGSVYKIACACDDDYLYLYADIG